MNITIFEKPLLPGYVYPCSVDDIRCKLNQLPKLDVQGLSAAGLVSAMRKDNSAYARYFPKPKPVIHILSFSDTLMYKQPPNIKRHHIEQELEVELEYGMRIEQLGSRWVCHWTAEELRHFVLDHVLLHEVGHHVFYQQRQFQGLENDISSRVKEQFAEDYAIRHSQK